MNASTGTSLLSNIQILTKFHPGILSGFIITAVLSPVSKCDSSFEHIEDICLLCAFLLRMSAYTSTWPDFVIWRVLLTSLADWKPFAMVLPLSLKPLVHTVSVQRFRKEVAGGSGNVLDSCSIKCGMHWWGNQHSLYDRVFSCCWGVTESLAFPFKPTQSLTSHNLVSPSAVQSWSKIDQRTVSQLNAETPDNTLTPKKHKLLFQFGANLPHQHLSNGKKPFVLFQICPR